MSKIKELPQTKIKKIEELTSELNQLLNEAKTTSFNSSDIVKNKNFLNSTKKNSREYIKVSEIKARLNPIIIEGIFKDLAPNIKPEGEFIKRGNNIFKGSLNMNLSEGKYHRFSEGTGGDIIHFIEQAKNVDTREAIKILADRVGIQRTIYPKQKFYPKKTPPSFKVEPAEISLIGKAIDKKDFKLRSRNKSSINEWITTKIVPFGARPLYPAQDLAFLMKQPNIEITHIFEYKNIYKRLLGYTIRIIETKIDSIGTELKQIKSVKPAAYCYNPLYKKFSWRLKGFLDNESKPIYRAEILSNNVTKPILIVEGEKTADIAKDLLPEFAVISWMGGAGAVRRVNWSQLKGKEVIIWPDNDKAGIDAAQYIITELGELNGLFGLAKIVDVALLDLPTKWDLADELPNHLSKTKIKLLLDQMLNNVGFKDTKEDLK